MLRSRTTGSSSLASTSLGFQASALLGLRLGTCGAIGLGGGEGISVSLSTSNALGLGFAETIELGALIAGERHGEGSEDAGLGVAGGES